MPGHARLPTAVWAGVGIAAVVGLQLVGRALELPDRNRGPDVRVLARGAACPAQQARPPVWTRAPGTTPVATGPPMNGMGYVNDFRFYGTWQVGGWTFRLVGFRPTVWQGWGDLIWYAFRSVKLRGRGVVTTAFTPRGLRFDISWASPRCRSVVLVGTTDGLAAWVAAHALPPPGGGGVAAAP
jgi:hypothetical protein